jgi:PadR family transcriptional regulator, regulatory protein PadR
MKKYYLGEFEEVVLLATAILHKNAYGVSIKDEIESRLDREVSMGAMHTALLRLEDKGYIRSSNGEATEERAGRPRKYYEITALGKKAIAYAKASRDKMWDAIPKVVMELNGSF